jgi:hypothetical protein
MINGIACFAYFNKIRGIPSDGALEPVIALTAVLTKT